MSVSLRAPARQGKRGAHSRESIHAAVEYTVHRAFEDGLKRQSSRSQFSRRMRRGGSPVTGDVRRIMLIDEALRRRRGR